MSDPETREHHSRRLHADETHVKKRLRLLKDKHSFVGRNLEKQPHRLHKVSGMNCGNPHCVMCMNPRKAWGDVTIQEKRFLQEKFYDDNNEGEACIGVYEDSRSLQQTQHSQA